MKLQFANGGAINSNATAIKIFPFLRRSIWELIAEIEVRDERLPVPLQRYIEQINLLRRWTICEYSSE